MPPSNALTVSRRLAAVLGADRNYHDTEFGPTNVAMHAVGVAVELGNGQQALDRAAHVRHAEQLSAERQARYLVDIARAHLLARSSRDALIALVKAEHIALLSRFRPRTRGYRRWCSEPAGGRHHAWRPPRPPVEQTRVSSRVMGGSMEKYSRSGADASASCDVLNLEAGDDR